jgi:hypothetical protein
MLREELQLLQEPGSYVGEVVKVMSKTKVLVKARRAKRLAHTPAAARRHAARAARAVACALACRRLALAAQHNRCALRICGALCVAPHAPHAHARTGASGGQVRGGLRQVD